MMKSKFDFRNSSTISLSEKSVLAKALNLSREKLETVSVCNFARVCLEAASSREKKNT